MELLQKLILMTLWVHTIRAGKWRTPNELPSPTFETKCRLLINELNLSTEDSSSKQFVEIGRYCPFDDNYQRSISMVGAYLVFITYDGYIYGICTFDNQLVSRTIVYEVPGTRKKRKVTQKYWLYLVGAGYDVDFSRDKCTLVPFLVGTDEVKTRFPIGVDYPMGVALLYNKYIDVFKDLKLNHNGMFYLKKKITPEIEETVVRYLQDFYIYGSKSRYQHCDYFDKFFKYEPDKYGLLRDRNSQTFPDRSISRCSKNDREYQVLPMQPQLWLTTQPSPGSINVCATGISFFIENYQDERADPVVFQYGRDPSFKCYSFTFNDGPYGAITTASQFQEQIQYAEDLDTSNRASSTDISSVVAAIDSTNDVAGSESNNDMVCQWEGNDNGGSEYTPDSTEAPTVLSSDAFESSLEVSKPYIWNDPHCARFTDQQRHEILSIPSNPISLDDILKKDVCNWFEYLIEPQLFRCKLCHSLFKQGIIFDTPDSKYVTGIMKSGVLSFSQKNKNYDNRKFIQDHLKSRFHQMSTQWFSLYDSGLRGADLFKEFSEKPGAFSDYMQSTTNFMIAVKQAIRLGIPFNKFKVLTETLVHFNVDIGRMYQNFDGMKAAVAVISKKMHKDFCRDLIAKNAPFTILLDGTTDIQTIPVVAVLFETYTVEEGTRIRLYKILKLEKGESGQQIFDAFMKEIREDGLEEYLSSNLHAVTSDGALNILSVFNTLLNSVTVQTVIPVWCGNHLVDKIYQNTVKQFSYLSRVSKVINSVYRVFSKSSKKKETLKNVAIEFGQVPFTVKRIHSIRWVSSNIRGFEIVLKGWKVIVEALTRITNDKTIPRRAREPYKGVISDLKDPMFLTSLAFLCDIGQFMSHMSLMYEQKGTTLIAKKSLRDDFKNLLETLIEAELDSVKYILSNSKYTPHDHAESVAVEYLQTFETQTVEFDGVMLTSPDAASIGKRLYENQRTYVETILDYVDFYFSPNIQDRFEVLNPNEFPSSVEQQETYGRDDISELNRQLKWGYNQQELLSSWSQVVKRIMADTGFETMKQKTPELFWEHYMSPSVDVGLTDSIKGVISKALSISSSNAESERVLSLYSGVKTYQRYLLLPRTVESILRIRINSDQAMNEREAQSYAKAFIMEGHYRSDAAGISKNDLNQQDWNDLVVYDDSYVDEDEEDDDCDLDDSNDV